MLEHLTRHLNQQESLDIRNTIVDVRKLKIEIIAFKMENLDISFIFLTFRLLFCFRNEIFVCPLN